jgi:hypothetical protein
MVRLIATVLKNKLKKMQICRQCLYLNIYTKQTKVKINAKNINKYLGKIFYE